MLFRNKNAKTAATGGWKMQRLIYRRNAAAQAESLRLLGLGCETKFFLGTE
jgi:hypothetical protein